jgi:hypothetical protein
MLTHAGIYRCAFVAQSSLIMPLCNPDLHNRPQPFRLQLFETEVDAHLFHITQPVRKHLTM